jgi:CRISPR-associated endonuclease/helicase Cas3
VPDLIDELSQALWAKTDTSTESASTRYHPLPCHTMDAAAVAVCMWDSVLTGASHRRFASGMHLDADEARVWLAFLCGAHDLGKASPVFQSKDPAAAASLRQLGLAFPSATPALPHGTATAFTLSQILVSEFGVSVGDARQLATAVGGHHGRFPTSRELNEASDAAAGKGRWDQVRSRICSSLAGLLPLPKRAPSGFDNATAALIAGFTSVCDWIASDEAFFPFAADRKSGATPPPLPEYWLHAEACASRALERLGWLAIPHADGNPGFADLFPDLKPRPLQESVCDVAADLRGPSLMLVEAPTGEGKTEAAFYLMQVWLRAEKQRGAYFALPTQATSNQMFTRIRAFLSRVNADAAVDLQLLHGNASLSMEFEQLRRNAANFLNPTHVSTDDAPQGTTGNLMAAEWFGRRKRGLLGPYGVGTVDQLLLCALQTRHVFVRLFGVASKTIVIDEVHAYDTYMSTLLARVLEWLGGLGTSVVLLSATLPSTRSRELLEAFGRGVGVTKPQVVPSQPYPRLSWITNGAQPSGSLTVATSPASRKQVVLRHLESSSSVDCSEGDTLRQFLLDRIGQSGCAAVVCNTVGEAQRLYRTLKPAFPGTADDGAPELDLLHSCFLFEERQRREERCIRRFGPDSQFRPKRAVLIATQIIEQSLDLDFDLLITDLAPVDLVLQRAGRLHRHLRIRPAGLERPILACSGLFE